MKRFNFTSLLLILLVLLPVMSFAQVEEKLDEGFSSIYITARIDGLSEHLTEIEATNCWHDNVESEYDLNRYVYDVKALESKSFFGLPVERIELKSASFYKEESSEEEEDLEYAGVNAFFLFISLPSPKEFDEFSTKIEDEYGPVLSTEINMEDDSETPLWFTSWSMMTFTNFDAPFVAADGKRYILVKFSCAQGG